MPLMEGRERVEKRFGLLERTRAGKYRSTKLRLLLVSSDSGLGLLESS